MYNNSKTFYVTFFILNENLQRHHLSNGSDGTYCIVYPHVASLRGLCFVEQVIVSFIAPVPVTHVTTVSVVQTVVNQNSNLEERTDIKDTRVSQKGTKKIRDGEDSLGVETTNLKKNKTVSWFLSVSIGTNLQRSTNHELHSSINRKYSCWLQGTRRKRTDWMNHLNIFTYDQRSDSIRILIKKSLKFLRSYIAQEGTIFCIVIWSNIDGFITIPIRDPPRGFREKGERTHTASYNTLAR